MRSNKFLNLLIMFSIVVSTISCSKESDYDDAERDHHSKPENKTLVYGNLTGDQIKFLGSWDASMSKISSFTFFADGTCRINGNRAKWNYAPNDRLLVTDYNDWSFHVSTLEEDLWTGTSAISGTANMSRRTRGNISVMCDILDRSSRFINEEAKDTISFFYYNSYDSYIATTGQPFKEFSAPQSSRETESEIDSMFFDIKVGYSTNTVKILNPYNPQGRIIVPVGYNLFKKGQYKTKELIGK